jgi:hypothetical protein
MSNCSADSSSAQEMGYILRPLQNQARGPTRTRNTLLCLVGSPAEPPGFISFLIGKSPNLGAHILFFQCFNG